MKIRPAPTTYCILGDEHKNNGLSPRPHADILLSVFFISIQYWPRQEMWGPVWWLVPTANMCRFHGCTMQRPLLFLSFLLRLTMFSSCPLELKGTCTGPCQPLPGATCLSIGNSLNDFVPGRNTEVSRSFCEIGTKPKRLAQWHWWQPPQTTLTFWVPERLLYWVCCRVRFNL